MATSTFFRLFGLLDGGDAEKGEGRSSGEREQEKSSVERGGGQEKYGEQERRVERGGEKRRGGG